MLRACPLKAPSSISSGQPQPKCGTYAPSSAALHTSAFPAGSPGLKSTRAHHHLPTQALPVPVLPTQYSSSHQKVTWEGSLFTLPTKDHDAKRRFLCFISWKINLPREKWNNRWVRWNQWSWKPPLQRLPVSKAQKLRWGNDANEIQLLISSKLKAITSMLGYYVRYHIFIIHLVSKHGQNLSGKTDLFFTEPLAWQLRSPSPKLPARLMSKWKVTDGFDLCHTCCWKSRKCPGKRTVIFSVSGQSSSGVSS